MREICTSGSVRGGGDNVPTYSAVLLPQPRDEVREGAFLAQPGVVTEEGECAGGMKFKQARQEQAAEQFGEDTDRQQEGRPGRHPARAVQRNAATWHDHVDVRMVRHRRAPGMEHGGDANARAKMTPVSGDGEHGL